MKATSSIILDIRRSTKNDNYPVKLRITYQRERKYYGLNIHLTEEEWKKVYGEKPREPYKAIRFKVDKILKEADSFIENMEVFSFSLFEKTFFNKGSLVKVKDRFNSYINELEKEGRVGTAISYGCARSSICKFDEELEFSDITEELLKKYEKWMIAQENSMTTIGIYLRSLRTLVNQSLQEGIIKPQQYPFGKSKYQIPTGKNVKKAINIDAIQKIIAYETIPYTNEDKARDFWLLSYLCNGANIIDICKLRYRNIEGDKLIFYRSKTERTSRNLKPIVVILADKTREIIDKWGTKPLKAENYIFPILNNEMSPKRQKLVVQMFIKTINKYMKRIAKELGIGSDLTTYVARHTYSTILKRNGVPLSYISDSLGHHTIQTTENYLDSFEDEQKKEFADYLLPQKPSANQ
jgi:integrase